MNSLVRAMLLLDIMMLNSIFSKSLDYNTGQNFVDRKNKSIFFVSHPSLAGGNVHYVAAIIVRKVDILGGAIQVLVC